MDIYPTMLAASGQPQRPEQHADGMNLLPLLVENELLKRRPIVFHFPHYTHATGPFSSIIEDDWKLIKFYNDEYGAHLLYNLAIDPEEQTNLAETNPEMLNQLLNSLDSSLAEMKAELPIQNPDFKLDKMAGRKNLKFTLELAQEERQMFKSRLVD